MKMIQTGNTHTQRGREFANITIWGVFIWQVREGCVWPVRFIFRHWSNLGRQLFLLLPTLSFYNFTWVELHYFYHSMFPVSVWHHFRSYEERVVAFVDDTYLPWGKYIIWGSRKGLQTRKVLAYWGWGPVWVAPCSDLYSTGNHLRLAHHVKLVHPMRSPLYSAI